MTKKRTKRGDAAPEAAPQAAEDSGADAAASRADTAAAGPMVTVLKTATASKLSPKGDGLLTYRVGRMDDGILVQIHANESSGRFSKEWVSVAAIRAALAGLPKGTALFKGTLVLKPAWKGQSSCNGGFGAAILKSEGVFVSDAEKKGMMKLASPGALDAWEESMLALKVPGDAERVPLNPPKPVPNFAKRPAKPADGGTTHGDAAGDTAIERAEDADPVEAVGEMPPEEGEA